MNQDEIQEEETYNILLIGPSQSGKSTLVAAIGQHFFPGSEIDYQSIGDGNMSCTEEVRVVEYESHFPEFELIDPYPSKKTKKAKVDASSILEERVHRKYRQKVGQFNDWEVRHGSPVSQTKSRFRIIDTPGLNDTGGQDVRNISEIVKAVSCTDKIHLVLLVVSLALPITLELQAALEDYHAIFSDMRGLLAFVHTKADFMEVHPENKRFTASFNTRKEALDKIMGREVPHFVINSNLEEDRPVCVYLRQSMIGNILSQVRLNVPVSVGRMQLVKTKQMKLVDSLVIESSKLLLKDIKRRVSNLQAKNTAQKADPVERAKNAAQLSLMVNEHQVKIREMEAEISRLDTDDLEFLAEGESRGWFFTRFTNEVQVSELECAIDHITEDCAGFKRKFLDGGVGYNFWTAVIHRRFWTSGSYRVKLYAKSRTKYHDKITQLKLDLIKEREEQDVLSNGLEMVGTLCSNEETIITKERQQFQADHTKNLEIITRAERETLHPNLFKAVAEAGVYEGSPIESAKKVAEFYAKYIPAEGEESLLDGIHPFTVSSRVWE